MSEILNRCKMVCLDRRTSSDVERSSACIIKVILKWYNKYIILEVELLIILIIVIVILKAVEVRMRCILSWLCVIIIIIFGYLSGFLPIYA